VVIPSWNSEALLRRCLDSLGEQGVELELLVVDNGSGDGSVALLEREGVPHLALPRNAGFAAAVNLGVSRTRSPQVLVLNADTVLEPGAVGALAAALAADPALGGVQPRLLQLGPEPADVATADLYSAGQALTRDGRALEVGAGEPQRPQWLRRREVFGVCGAACLLRRQLFDQLGGYDERYFAFYEDVDLNLRAQIAGWGFAYEPDAVVWHVGNASWQVGFERPGAERHRVPVSGIAHLSEHAILVGYGRVGGAIGPVLRKQNLPLVVIERDHLMLASAQAAGIPTLVGDASLPDVLSAAGVGRARLLAVATPDGFQARRIVEIARQLNPHIEIVARTHSAAEFSALESLGAGAAFVGHRRLLPTARCSPRDFNTSAHHPRSASAITSFGC